MFSSNFGAHGFRSWGSPFWITPRDPNLNFVPSASWEFCSVSRRRVLVCPAFHRIDFFGSEFWDTQHRTIFSFRIETAPWVVSLVDLLLGFSSPSASRYRQYCCHGCTCFQTCNHDTLEDADNHTTILYILSPHRQGILPLVAGLASRLVERLSSVRPFPVGTEEGACSLPFRLRSLLTAGLRLDIPVFFTSSADVSRFPEARECTKLQESPFEQDPFAFHWKHSPVFRLVKELCPFPLVTATRSAVSLWILKCLLLWPCSKCNFTHIPSLWWSRCPPPRRLSWLFSAIIV